MFAYDLYELTTNFRYISRAPEERINVASMYAEYTVIKLRLVLLKMRTSHRKKEIDKNEAIMLENIMQDYLARTKDTTHQLPPYLKELISNVFMTVNLGLKDVIGKEPNNPLITASSLFPFDDNSTTSGAARLAAHKQLLNHFWQLPNLETHMSRQIENYLASPLMVLSTFKNLSPENRLKFLRNIPHTLKKMNYTHPNHQQDILDLINLLPPRDKTEGEKLLKSKPLPTGARGSMVAELFKGIFQSLLTAPAPGPFPHQMTIDAMTALQSISNRQ